MKFHPVIILPGLVLCVCNAMAATGNATLKVTVGIAASCTIAKASDVDFVVIPGAADITASGGVNVTCTNGAPWTLAITDSANGTVAQPQMISGTDLLPYEAELAKDYGTGTGGPEAVAVNGTLARLAINNASVGEYEDTLTVTLTY